MIPNIHIHERLMFERCQERQRGGAAETGGEVASGAFQIAPSYCGTRRRILDHAWFQLEAAGSP